MPNITFIIKEIGDELTHYVQMLFDFVDGVHTQNNFLKILLPHVLDINQYLAHVGAGFFKNCFLLNLRYFFRNVLQKVKYFYFYSPF